MYFFKNCNLFYGFVKINDELCNYLEGDSVKDFFIMMLFIIW